MGAVSLEEIAENIEEFLGTTSEGQVSKDGSTEGRLVRYTRSRSASFCHDLVHFRLHGRSLLEACTWGC